MTIAYALVENAWWLNEPGTREQSNYEYMRGQANLICDALGWPGDDMYLPVMACLAHQITIEKLFEILRGQAVLSPELEADWE